MKTPHPYDGIFDGIENNLDFLMECAIVDFTEEMARIMNEKGISRSELARRMGTSPAYITKILDGNANFTLKSMVKIAKSLDTDFHCRLANSKDKIVLYKYSNGKKASFSPDSFVNECEGSTSIVKVKNDTFEVLSGLEDVEKLVFNVVENEGEGVSDEAFPIAG